MAGIKPFIGIRPNRDMAEKIAALPYDVYDRAEARSVVEAHPDSFLKIDRPETQFPEDMDMYADEVYARAGEILQEMRKSGQFVTEEKPCYYIYELTMNGRCQTGIVACASIDDYKCGVIKKHENTRKEKELDRIHHVDTLSAQTGPIFLAYREQKFIDEIVEAEKQKEALYDFIAEDGIRHRVFVIDEDCKIQALQQAFLNMQEIYIADGHHRAASAVRVGEMRREAHPGYTGDEEFNFFLSVLFPDQQLMIMDYNRVVKDLNGYTTSEFLEKVKEIFDVEKMSGGAKKPEEKGKIAMYLENQWWKLTIPSEQKKEDPVEGLDVSLLQNLLLCPILGINDPKTDERIDFVGGIRGMEELERRVHSDCAVAFSMYPTGIAELFAVADAGRLMPPKSTWFEPKLRSGLFIHEIEQ